MKRIGLASFVCLAICGPALGDGQALEPLRDPWVPPGARSKAQSPQSAPAQGPGLQAQVERKLRANFERADTEGRGSITVEQARAAQLGFIVEHFSEIDRSGSGRVSFDDFRRFLVARGARTL